MQCDHSMLRCVSLELSICSFDQILGIEFRDGCAVRMNQHYQKTKEVNPGMSDTTFPSENDLKMI